MKYLLLVLAASLGWAAGQQAAYNPCANVNNGAVANGPPLPDLPTKSFKSVVRAVLIDKNTTIEAREYASETANAATLVIMYQGQQQSIIMDYNTDQAFYISPYPDTQAADTLCMTNNLSTDPNRVLFGMSPNPNTQMPHHYSLDKVLQLSKNATLVYKGRSTKYDVLTDHWTTCLKWILLNSTFTLDYYFTVPNYITPSGNLPVPVAAEVQGLRIYPDETQYLFHHVYQYINFEPYVDDPESVFNTPPGVSCIGRMSTLPVPSIDTSFYYRVEESDPISSTFSQASIWYDYGLQLTRTDSRLYPVTQSTSLSSVGPYTVIHDYRTGVQYAIDNSNGACSIDPIPTDATGYDAVYNLTTDTLSIRDPMQFFNIEGGDQIVWVGQRPVRGLQADVFQKFTNQIPGRGGVVYEVYFIKNALDATDVGRDAQANRSVPVLIMEWEDGTLVNEYNIYDFDQDSPTYNVFDVSPCFSGSGSVDFEMAFSAPSTIALPSLTDLVVDLIRLSLALSVPMTPIRLQRTRLRWDSQYVFLEGTILDRAPPHTKYRFYPNVGMQASDGRQVLNIADVDTCADACQKLKDWHCTTFDYCPGSKTCILGKIVNNRQSMSLLNSTTCNHYASVVAGDNIAEPTLFDAWQAIQNSLYAPGLTIDVPLNISNLGLVNPPSQTLTLTALWIQNEAGSLGMRKNSSTGPPLPSLPLKAFKSTVRGIILNRNMTVVAQEYVDEDANAGALVLMQAGQETTMIMSYNTNEIFYISDNPSPDGFKICEVSVLSNDTNSQLFGVGPSNGTKMPHLYSTSKILEFAKQFGEVYKGMTFVDGVPTNRWTSSMYWSMLNSNFTLDYYFTVPNYTSPGGGQSIPVMAEVQGRTSFLNLTFWNFHHVYQYVDFEPYVDDPESKFNTPPGVFCIGRKNMMQLPNLTSSFSYKQEVSDPTLSWIIESSIWYDYGLQLIRVDVREAPDVTSTPLSQVGPYTMIHDYGTGVQYTIDHSNGACSIDPLPADAQGFDASLNITRGTLSMRNPLQLFNLLNDSQYVGQRTVRGGQQADVFQRLTDQLPGHGLVIYEVYFLNSTTVWTDVGNDVNRRVPVPVRIMEWENGQLVNEINIFDFDEDSPESDAYDISPCFNNYQSIEFEMAFTTKTTVPMPSIAREAMGLIRLAVSVAALMSPIRLQSTRLHWVDRTVYLQGTITDRAPPLAKYEYHPKQMMQTNAGKSAPNTPDAKACASLCDNSRECSSFDYCASQKMCVIGKAATNNQPVPLINNTNCDYYSRVIGGSFDNEPSLLDAWTNLKNAVYGKGIAVDLPLTGSYSTIVNSDTPQTLTLNAKWITDQVVSTVNRNSAGASLQQFQALPNTEGKGFDEMIRGVSVDDCAQSCVSEQTFNCQSFAYCWDAGSCMLSRQHPDETPRLLKKSPACDLYFRNYTSDYQKFDGQTVLSNSDTVYQNVFSDSSCAKLCTYYTSFKCESFDYCSNLGTCFLGRQHFYDVPKANIQQVPMCAHYSRNYINEFLSTAHKTVQLRDNRIVVNVAAEECAKLCVEEPTFTCMSFDFCANISECRLSDASVSNTGQVTLDASAYCDVYSRQSTSGGSSSSSQSSSSGYSSGSMGGLGFTMLVLGLAVGAVAVFLYFRRKSLPGDGMQMSFTKLSSDT